MLRKEETHFLLQYSMLNDVYTHELYESDKTNNHLVPFGKILHIVILLWTIHSPTLNLPSKTKNAASVEGKHPHSIFIPVARINCKTSCFVYYNTSRILFRRLHFLSSQSSDHPLSLTTPLTLTAHRINRFTNSLHWMGPESFTEWILEEK